MNRFFIGILFTGASMAISSCSKQENTVSLYYPVDSLITAQVNQLTKSKAQLTKRAEIDGVEETNSFTPKDSTAWANELDIFAELNVMNSRSNYHRYSVENGAEDANSNLTIRSYTGIGTRPVVYFKVYYLDSPSRVKRIEALYQEENSLVKGSRLLILEFQEIENKTFLTAYSIEGSQKMFLGESVKFSIKGVITLL